MPTVEEELIASLTQHAESLPPDPRLLSTIKVRSHRAAVRNRVALMTLVAAAVAAVVAIPSVGLHVPTRGGSQPAAPAAGFLVAAPRFAPSFPLTPAYLPPGLQPRPELSGSAPYTNAGYRRVHPGSDESQQVGLSIAVIDAKTLPKFTPAAVPTEKARSVTVNGHPGTFTVSKSRGVSEVTWRARPGQWVIVTAFSGFDDFETGMKIANGLVARPIGPASQIKIKYAPRGVKVQDWNETTLNLSRLGVEPITDTIWIEAVKATSSLASDGKVVRVGTRSGWLYTDTHPRQLILVIKATPQTFLVIRVPSTAAEGWTQERLFRFAAGVTYTGAAPTRTVVW